MPLIHDFLDDRPGSENTTKTEQAEILIAYVRGKGDAALEVTMTTLGGVG